MRLKSTSKTMVQLQVLYDDQVVLMSGADRSQQSGSNLVGLYTSAVEESMVAVGFVMLHSNGFFVSSHL